MKGARLLLYAMAVILMVCCKPTEIDRSADKKNILAAIENWNNGWDKIDITLALKDYDDQVDLTNTFGERVHSKAELQKLLENVFKMNNVMAGVQNYIENDVEFVNDDIALVRSQNIRKGQEFSDGTKMADRYINHLRVFQKKNGRWKIISHMISEAQVRK